jgi:hypothetical protein
MGNVQYQTLCNGLKSCQSVVLETGKGVKKSAKTLRSSFNAPAPVFQTLTFLKFITYHRKNY